MTATPNYEQLLIDASRSRDKREKGLATRPERALRAKRFAELRTPPWRLQLAIALTWCVRTGQLDASGDWPYERLDEGMRSGRLRAKGADLPAHILIDVAIDEVLAIVERASREHQRADEATDWFTANIGNAIGPFSPASHYSFSYGETTIAFGDGGSVEPVSQARNESESHRNSRVLVHLPRGRQDA